VRLDRASEIAGEGHAMPIHFRTPAGTLFYCW
jgi:hypothetical protein